MLGFCLVLFFFFVATHRKVLQKFFPKHSRNNDAKTPRETSEPQQRHKPRAAHRLQLRQSSLPCDLPERGCEDVGEPRRTGWEVEKLKHISSLRDTENVKLQRKEMSQKVFHHSHPCTIQGCRVGWPTIAKRHFFQFFSKTLSGWREEKFYVYSSVLKYMTKPGC